MVGTISLLCMFISSLFWFVLYQLPSPYDVLMSYVLSYRAMRSKARAACIKAELCMHVCFFSCCRDDDASFYFLLSPHKWGAGCQLWYVHRSDICRTVQDVIWTKMSAARDDDHMTESWTVCPSERKSFSKILIFKECFWLSLLQVLVKCQVSFCETEPLHVFIMLLSNHNLASPFLYAVKPVWWGKSCRVTQSVQSSQKSSQRFEWWHCDPSSGFPLSSLKVM